MSDENDIKNFDFVDYILSQGEHENIYEVSDDQPGTSSCNNTSRFATAFLSDIENDIETHKIAINTAIKQKWVRKVFRIWLDEWKMRIDNTLKVYKDISEFITSDLNYCLQFFYCEVRKVNGERYPPATLKEFAALIQHYFNNKLGWQISVFKDPEFRQSTIVLDTQMKKSASLGLVKPKRKSSIITFEHENELWENNIFGRSNPKQLQSTLLYHLGIHLSLRASQEHRDLTFGENSQLELKVDDTGIEYLHYTERISKNKKFGLKQCRMEPKETSIYPRVDNEERCVVSLYKEFIRRRPESNGGKCCEAFYLAVLPAFEGRTQWFKSAPLGVHSIEQTTKFLMDQLTGQQRKSDKVFSNSSLRRTVKNRMIQGGISKEVAQKKTGRISDSADSAYIDASLYEKEMSSAIYGPSTAAKVPRLQNVQVEIQEEIRHSFSMAQSPVFSNCNVTINNYYTK